MKKFISILLACLLLLSFTSCSKDGGQEDTTDKNEAEETKQYQTYDDLEYKSDIRFTDEELLTFTHEKGEFVTQPGQIVGIFNGGTGFSAAFDSSGMETYSKLSTPFGVTVGDSLSDLCENFKLDTGYAAYATKNDGIIMYDESENIEYTKDGGCGMYVGFAKDGMGNWAYMDYYMLMMLLQNSLVIQGAEDTEYNVIVYSFVINEEGNIAQITQMYGEINTLMTYISK